MRFARQAKHALPETPYCFAGILGPDLNSIFAEFSLLEVTVAHVEANSGATGARYSLRTALCVLRPTRRAMDLC
jgi:hypothetical protein